VAGSEGLNLVLLTKIESDDAIHEAAFKGKNKAKTQNYPEIKKI
jgi:hypothetical protein